MLASSECFKTCLVGLGQMGCAASLAKMMMPIAARAMAVVKHGVVTLMVLRGWYIQHRLFQADAVPIMSLPVRSF